MPMPSPVNMLDTISSTDSSVAGTAGNITDSPPDNAIPTSASAQMRPASWQTRHAPRRAVSTPVLRPEIIPPR